MNLGQILRRPVARQGLHHRRPSLGSIGVGGDQSIPRHNTHDMGVDNYRPPIQRAEVQDGRGHFRTCVRQAFQLEPDPLRWNRFSVDAVNQAPDISESMIQLSAGAASRFRLKPSCSRRAPPPPKNPPGIPETDRPCWPGSCAEPRPDAGPCPPQGDILDMAQDLFRLGLGHGAPIGKSGFQGEKGPPRHRVIGARAQAGANELAGGSRRSPQTIGPASALSRRRTVS